MINALESSSTRPYLIRALYEWCTDNGFTPYVAVQVDDSVQVPREYVKNGEIVLNISFDATSSLKLGNDFIEFKARFAGTAREIMRAGRPRDRDLCARERAGHGVSRRRAPTRRPMRRCAQSAGLAPASRLPLRDASRGTEGDASKVVHLVSGDARREADDAPTRRRRSRRRAATAAPNGGARPSLKRDQVTIGGRASRAPLESDASRRFSSVGRATAL